MDRGARARGGPALTLRGLESTIVAAIGPETLRNTQAGSPEPTSPPSRLSRTDLPVQPIHLSPAKSCSRSRDEVADDRSRSRLANGRHELSARGTTASVSIDGLMFVFVARRYPAAEVAPEAAEGVPRGPDKDYELARPIDCP